MCCVVLLCVVLCCIVLCVCCVLCIYCTCYVLCVYCVHILCLVWVWRMYVSPVVCVCVQDFTCGGQKSTFSWLLTLATLFSLTLATLFSWYEVSHWAWAPGSVCLHPAGTRVTDTSHHTKLQLFHRCWECELKSSCLLCKYWAHWTISPDLECILRLDYRCFHGKLWGPQHNPTLKHTEGSRWCRPYSFSWFCIICFVRSLFSKLLRESR